jgi:hypothetical protein
LNDEQELPYFAILNDRKQKRKQYTYIHYGHRLRMRLLVGIKNEPENDCQRGVHHNIIGGASQLKKSAQKHYTITLDAHIFFLLFCTRPNGMKTLERNANPQDDIAQVMGKIIE